MRHLRISVGASESSTSLYGEAFFNSLLGIDFIEGHTLIEASLCPIPANPRCLVIGPATGTKSAGHGDVDIADRRREVRVLAAKARSRSESITVSAPQTREQRMAEARNLRRIAMEANR
jgi:hypothetical protein